jgi:hypothetical protein
MKTAKQVEKEIAMLVEMKPRVLRRSGFGEDHHEAIDAQIKVLKERMSEDRIYDIFQPVDEDGEPDDEGNRHDLDSALEAKRWLDGEGDAPSKGWKELVR